MFHIEFIDDEPELQEDGWLGLWGRITLGEYEERFLAPVGYWSRADYVARHPTRLSKVG